MKWMSLNDIRESFLSYFESQGHLRLDSFPLVPKNDKSILLINAGMTPLKKYFTGEEVPPRKRVATCQKCIRTPDLDRVGHTARHGTYFEMLGNFSFGDYFKAEALAMAWEYLTKVLEIPGELLWPSIYSEDEEAFKIWTEDIGVPAERVVRLGRADNFWEHGQGPCGPCSEIYFDRGEKYGCGSPDCKPGCDCDRYMEIWNNVFSQFNNDGNGNYTELVQKNIDTGMGLERLACVMQGVDNLFEVDTVRKILDTVCAISGKTYGLDNSVDTSIRIVTDHIRGSTFMVSDGIIPSNEGRGYVLRRIIRRACRHGKLLGINRNFLCELCEVVIGENVSAYPELAEKKDYILKVIAIEEERFNATIDAGLNILTNIINDSLRENKLTISGEDAFRLYDTFGFPLDLTKEIVAENHLSIDEQTFTELMKAQRERARAARGNVGGWDESSKTALSTLPKTEFTGYDKIEDEATVVAIISEEDGNAFTVDEVNEGSFTLVLDKTPFYGEGGGQVGDIGTIKNSGCTINVSDTKKTDGIFLHICTLANGSIKVGDKVTAEVTEVARRSTMRNHSACHLLQAALRTVLGTHVEQAGSYVDPHHLRFDFSHFEAMTKEQIKSVETLVNAHILLGEDISMKEMPIEEAKKLGAMALFGEKYGDVVRVVKMGNFSTELCGGTHMDNTGKIGLFKILSETGVAAGVRRIEATTGANIINLIYDKDNLISATASELKTQNVSDIAKRASSLQDEIRALKHEIESLNAKLAHTKLDKIVSDAKAVGSVNLYSASFTNEMQVDAVRSLCDDIKNKDSKAVCVFSVVNGDKLNFVTACGKDAVSAGVHAGKLAGSVSAVTGGKGGGRPDSAMAGGKDIAAVDAALASAEATVSGMLK